MLISAWDNSFGIEHAFGMQARDKNLTTHRDVRAGVTNYRPEIWKPAQFGHHLVSWHHVLKHGNDPSVLVPGIDDQCIRKWGLSCTFWTPATQLSKKKQVNKPILVADTKW